MIKINIIFTVLYVIVHNGNSYPKIKYGSLLSKSNNCEASVITRYYDTKQEKTNSSAVWHRSDCVNQWKRRRRTSQNYETEDKTDEIISGTPTEMKQNYPQSTINLHSWNESDTSLIIKFKSVWPVKLWKKYGLFTDDYLMLINRHWLKFAPPDPAANYGLGAFYILMTASGCFGNGLVLILYLRCSTLRTPGNILVANLALSDFLMLAKTPIFIFNSFNLGPALGKNGCVIYGFIGGMTGVTSIATLAAIALDRYWAVVRPLEPLRALTAIRARLLAIGAWLYAALFASVPALDIGYGRYVPEGYLTSCSFDYLTDEDPPRYFIFVFFCAGWVAPFCTISFCYLNIFRVVVCNRNVSAKNQDRSLSSRHVKEQTKRKAEIKLAVLVIGVIALFFISWTPYAVVALLGIFGKKELITPLVSMIPALFCKTAACVNPFVYIITHPKFRGEFKKMLFRRTSRRSDGTFKSTGYTMEMSKIQRASRDLSDTDVEIVEMKDIPYQCETVSQKKAIKVNTVSSRVSEREGSQKSQRSVSMKSFEESVVSPPSWYVKPKFTNKKRSFRRHSSKSTISLNTDPIVI